MKSPIAITLTLTSILINCTNVSQGTSTGAPTTVSQSPFSGEVEFTLPARGAPGNRKGKRTGAATRDPCSAFEGENEPLTALVPGTNLGLTVTERPTFWFYVPYASNSRLSVEFFLKEREENELYKQTFPLTNTPGIVSIRLPETGSPLEVKKLYTWHFSVVCPEAKVKVEGAVEKVSQLRSVSSQLEGATELERISFYAKNGLWFDTLTNLAELYRTNPQDKALKDNWANLWQDVGLEYITSKPLVSCCTSGQ